MPDNRNYLVKNTERVPSKENGLVYEYFTKGGIPIAFSKDAALIAARGDEDRIELVPDDMVVVLDPSARKLPQSPDSNPLDQVAVERTM